MSKIFNKWVAMWGNAMSITENKPEGYAKDITLRYPIVCPFDGNKIRLTFDNYCGTEPVYIEKTVLMLDEKMYPVTFAGERRAEMEAGAAIVSDEVNIDVVRGKELTVSFYLKDYTQMRSSVVAIGPRSGGEYAMGDCTEVTEFDVNISRKINVHYFLSNVSVYTEEKNRAVVCYGDSITAQDWPDLLAEKLVRDGIDNIAIIRRAASGTRILREYTCITYESYGMMGSKRFLHEVPTDGADTVIIQQGINDIIHPVGTDVNIFRPMSDLPTVDELSAGLDKYVQDAKKLGYRVAVGTLLPIEGWRTYADFREDLKNAYNTYIRQSKEIDAVIDFDRAVQNPANPKAYADGYDSGDHLHPSKKGYDRMAEEALKFIKTIL